MILLTGATGFIGGAILERKLDAVVLGRSCPMGFDGKFIKHEFSVCSDYSGCFDQVSCVIHCAARVHVMSERSYNPLQLFRDINVAGTLNFARQAASSGVKRFVFLSSIKVNGESTAEGIKYSPNDQPDPSDPYGISKYEAEQGLKKIAEETNMEIVIIRPVLVYGVGVKGNFASILNLIRMGVPIPLAAVNNRRSLIALDNLVDFIIHCADFISTPQAANEVFLISDGEDISTLELIRRVGNAFQKRPVIFSIPLFLLRFGAIFFGKQKTIERLLGSLQVDSSKARNLLSWKPVITMDEQLKKMADAFIE